MIQAAAVFKGLCSVRCHQEKLDGGTWVTSGSAPCPCLMALKVAQWGTIHQLLGDLPVAGGTAGVLYVLSALCCPINSWDCNLLNPSILFFFFFPFVSTHTSCSFSLWFLFYSAFLGVGGFSQWQNCPPDLIGTCNWANFSLAITVDQITSLSLRRLKQLSFIKWCLGFSLLLELISDGNYVST